MHKPNVSDDGCGAHHDWRERDSNLADAFESVVGAIYQDGGIDHARDVILQLLAPDLAALNPAHAQGNSKGELQEILQKITPDSPHYKVVAAEGPPHDRIFTCVVTWLGRELGQGIGPSKKSAEAEAAQAALISKLWEE